MSSLSQIKYEIPRRANSCHLKNEPFTEGMELISVLTPTSEGYERKDYCLICFESISQPLAQQDGYIYWKSTIATKKDWGKKYSRDERALLLLKEMLYTAPEPGSAPPNYPLQYVLALYLERRRQLVKRQEKRSKINPLIFYEVSDTGEVLVIKKVELSMTESAQIQQELALKLCDN